jgi:hypothetical protein
MEENFVGVSIAVCDQEAIENSSSDSIENFPTTGTVESKNIFSCCGKRGKF